MFTDWNTQHGKDIRSPQVDLYRFNAISIKILAKCFTDTDKLILKFLWKSQETRIGKTILKEKKSN